MQQALDAIHGVDLNPFAVAIARFRLTVAALKACELTSLEGAPAFRLHLAVGDSLLHGTGQQTLQNDTDLSHFAYSTEDLGLLEEILSNGRYDVVVGNPPYIAVKDRVLRDAYRAKYPRVCSGKYVLTVPFMARFFGLAKGGNGDTPAGWVGQITSNSFMKREFGRKLVEDFLPRKDLQLVVDSSGAYIPGHGTPTVILAGRNQNPVGASIRTVLGVRGEPGRPSNPAKGVVWRSIVDHVGDDEWEDSWITVADLSRSSLSSHPWSLTGGGAVQLQMQIEGAGNRTLAAVVKEIGIVAVIGEEDAFELRPGAQEPSAPLVVGDAVRDFRLSATPRFWPYDDALNVTDAAMGSHSMWPFRRVVSGYLMFGKTRAERGLRWLEYGMLAKSKLKTPLSIAFAFVATHNHFVLDRGGRIFKQSAPVIKLPSGASDSEHLELLGVLNSSTACFWLKQNSHNKGEGGGARVDAGFAARGEPFRETYEFTSTTLQDFPLPSALPAVHGGQLDNLAQEQIKIESEALSPRVVPTHYMLRHAELTWTQVGARMVAVQEELDWEVYRLYGLADEDLTYSGEDLPALEPGQRAFEVALARKVAAGLEETSWFSHGQQLATPITELPADWPAAYRALVERRLEVIESEPNIRLLERPEYKRRWAGDSWEKRQTTALREWLLERLEDRRFWFDRQGRPAPRSVAQLADEVARDADVASVLALWEGRPDVPVLQSLTKLLADEAVPFLAAYRYKDSGLRKREAWEQTWALQRREDAGEAVGPVPVPPKYTSADFRKTSYWQARGKLDVPKERFILYPDAGRETDPTPLLGWAGWDHAQQSLALSVIIGAREAEGWTDERLVPLVAGLAELQPWVEQWHADIDPAYGVSLAAFCREQLTTRAAQVGQTLDQLTAWRPAPATRGRKPKITT